MALKGPALAILVVVWYALSSGYSLYAKIGLREDPEVSDAVLTLMQLVLGAAASGLALGQGAWGIVELASRSPSILLIAAAYTAGAALTSASMALGSVAIAYVIKSTEPLGSVALSRLLLGQRFSAWTLATMLPLCLGLVLACYSPAPATAESAPEAGGGRSTQQLAGALLALAANMGMSVRNVTTKLRQVLRESGGRLTAAGRSKSASGSDVDTLGAAAPPLPNPRAQTKPGHLPAASALHCDDSAETVGAPAANGASPAPASRLASPPLAPESPVAVFGAVSLCGSVLALLLVLADPSGRSQSHLAALPGRLAAGSPADVSLVYSAACHAGYTLCSFVALGTLEPATHAVVTALKQLSVIVAAALLLGSPMTALQVLGAAMAVGGVALYGVVRSRDPLRAELRPWRPAAQVLTSRSLTLLAAAAAVVLVAVARPYPPAAESAPQTEPLPLTEPLGGHPE
ncbi:hypothetical protein FNF29_03494 [Cafeteria roenbergensis]|uniref:Sugar phosphate transporter domain-containing protein n=1 Tax=Cafeteria roenbergensis TaxID=33653 RepID=A0A5A8CMA5_CAFRO|nr:hypothetical protein FNF29_03494 [Cafeteria roenbergensis]|eukprot:KAA0152971.1 hypothetical protein FNF29_03494 [Cafeteria roenbergensis]